MVEIYTETQIDEVVREAGVFSLRLGLSKLHVEQLQTYSLDETDTALSVTSDRLRFGEQPYEAWFEKDRTPYSLINTSTNALASLVWFGPKELGKKSMKFEGSEEEATAPKSKEEWHTLAYRCYKPYRGSGLMKEFFQKAMQHYRTLEPQAKLWAIIDTENPASTRLAEASGFVAQPELSDTEHTVMIHAADV